MTLTDASILVALVDKRQAAIHTRCQSALSTLPSPLLTTWPCFTEAMYLVSQTGGWPMKKLLWDFVKVGALRFYSLTDADADRMQGLMEQCRDTPMDLADASLVAAAEILGQKRIFTLDSHFYIYQRNGHDPFEVVP